MTDREQALLSLVRALWHELAAVRDDAGLRSPTRCFDHGSDRGPVRSALIDCCGRGLAEEIEAATGEPMSLRLGGFEDSLRAAWRRDRDAQAVKIGAALTCVGQIVEWTTPGHPRQGPFLGCDSTE